MFISAHGVIHMDTKNLLANLRISAILYVA
jgi:hypothetical protein